MSDIDPSPAERLEAADAELAKINDILMRFWLERHQVYAAIRDVKTLRHNLGHVKAELSKTEKPSEDSSGLPRVPSWMLSKAPRSLK